MTEQSKLSAELQSAQDMINGLQNQRNAAQNECVQLAAQVAAAQRIIADKDAKIATLEAKVKELTPPEEPKANGHAAEATA